jgi:hypothetical protein
MKANIRWGLVRIGGSLGVLLMTLLSLAPSNFEKPTGKRMAMMAQADDSSLTTTPGSYKETLQTTRKRLDEVDYHPCGKPTDPCMTIDNWNQCRELVQQGCQMLETMESCPLQFACGDQHI